MKILVVEDDEFVAQALSAVLTRQNYAVEIASNGEAAWDLVEAFEYDLIILDITLPKLDGIGLCRRIRSGGWLIPIMLVTGCDNTHEKAVGLDAGADDYVVKPFEEEELVARIRALLRRGKVNLQPLLEWGALQLDPTSCEVNYDTKNISLTPKEYSLLELFLRNSRRVFSCGMILEHLWSYEDIPSEEAVRTHIKGLRMKLKTAGAPSNFIETVYGIGYRLKPQEEKKKRREENETKISSSQVTQAQTLLAIAGVWEKYKGRISKQVNVLLKASEVLQNQGYLSSELLEKATAEAHTLAGSLGTFGFAEGSKLARQIESFLRADNLKAEKILDEANIKQFNSWVKALVAQIDSSSQTPVISSDSKENIQDGIPLLLVIDANEEISENLENSLNISSDWGLQVKTANSVITARQKLYQEHPDVVLICSNFFVNNDEGLSLLAEFENRKPPVPVIVLTEERNQNQHLKFIHNSGTTILQNPLPSEQILEAVTQAVKKSEDVQTTVLAVDNDPKVLELLQSLLKYWGIKVKTLAEPQKFWETLERIQPDLLILDVEMPGISGIEICYEVRNHSRWSELPILFLTVYSGSEIVNQVFSAGADDLVSKPIVGPELVTRIVNRLERVKLIRQMTKARGKHNSSEPERWCKIFHTSGECINLVAADGTLLEMNPAGLAMIEADKAIIGKNIYSIITPEYRQAFEDLNKSICQGNQGNLEFEIITLKGNRRILEAYGVPLLNPENGQLIQLAITRDITARKQAETEKEKINLLFETKVKQQADMATLGQLQLELGESQRSQSLFAGIVESTSDAIISIDTNQCIILFNQGAEIIFGYYANEVLRKSLDLLLPEGSVEVYRHHVATFGNSATKSRKMGERSQIYGKRKDGREFPAEASISKLNLDSKTVYTVYLQDVSNRKQIEHMKDEFVSVISHELRTPLTSIHGSLGMLANGLIEANSEDGMRLLQIATDSAERLVKLINDILDIERIESGKVAMYKETCQVADLIAQAINIVQPLADKAQVKLEVDNSPLQMKVDCDRIIQTLTNLLSNAIRFSNSGATVYLTAFEQDSKILFALKDTGRGIPQDKLENIFERFQQVDSSDSRNHEGTGLGLAICRSIIELHGGNIWVESSLGLGSTFYFTLPFLDPMPK